jgi:hypothetical protein
MRKLIKLLSEILLVAINSLSLTSLSARYHIISVAVAVAAVLSHFLLKII